MSQEPLLSGTVRSNEDFFGIRFLASADGRGAVLSGVGGISLEARDVDRRVRRPAGRLYGGSKAARTLVEMVLAP
jgi:hypothetical protein